MAIHVNRKRPIKFVVWMNAQEREELRRLAEKERLNDGALIRILIRDAARRQKRAA